MMAILKITCVHTSHGDQIYPDFHLAWKSLAWTKSQRASVDMNDVNYKE